MLPWIVTFLAVMILFIEHEIVNAGPRTFMFALVPEYMTGKKVKEA